MYEIKVGDVAVKTTQNTGLTPEYLDRKNNGTLSFRVGDNADPLVQAQARAFKENIEKVVLLYMKTAI